jgi:glycosyltransferase involved in cell wall biosynthesis
MRVGYDGSPLLGNLTGVGYYARTLLEKMIEVDQEITFDLLAVALKGSSSAFPELPRVNRRYVRFPSRIAVLAWDRMNWPKADKVMGGFDVFHGTNFWVPPLRRPNGVVTIHDLTFHFYPEFCTSQVKRYRWLIPKVLKRCALVLVPSQTIRAQVAAELAFPEDRIVVTPEGVRGAFTRPPKSLEIIDRLGLNDGYFLFVGTKEPRKNLPRLIEAMKLLRKDLKLVIVGPQGWGEIDLEEHARKLDLEGRVIFPGYLGDEELTGLLSRCRAFVFPTIYEGFGLPPLEAMTAGIPVVSSNTGSLPEVLRDSPFYCDPLDVESIADAMKRVDEDEDARVAAIKAGKAVVSSYSWEETARLTLAAYETAAR